MRKRIHVDVAPPRLRRAVGIRVLVGSDEFARKFIALHGVRDRKDRDQIERQNGRRERHARRARSVRAQEADAERPVCSRAGAPVCGWAALWVRTLACLRFSKGQSMPTNGMNRWLRSARLLSMR